jgi:alcohol dehydrogenase class IV
MIDTPPTDGFWKFSTADNIHFGRGCVSALKTVFANVECSRVLIVTDENLTATGNVSTVTESILASGNCVEVFDGSQAEPTIQTVLKALTFARVCKADAIVGLGGGSNMDVAKLTGMLLKHPGIPQDFFGFDRVPGPITPVIAMPTTAGTGSEVSHSAVVTDTENQMKVSTLSRWLRPYAAIVDPGLTDTCPPHVAAHSGMDALSHAIEAFLSRSHHEMDNVDFETRAYEGANPLCDLFASQAIQLIGHSLSDVVLNPTPQARNDLSLAATLGGMAFSNAGVGLIHALEYPIGADVGCSHGQGTGLLLPHVMRFLLPVRRNRMTQIGVWLNVPPGSTRSMDELALAAIERVELLIQKIGLPSRLRDHGVRAEDLGRYAAKAFSIKRLVGLSPCDVSQDDLLAILKAAF